MDSHSSADRLYGAGWLLSEIAETLSGHLSSVSPWLKARACRAAVPETRDRFASARVPAAVVLADTQ